MVSIRAGSAVLAFVLAAAPIMAWSAEGHRRITAAAVESLSGAGLPFTETAKVTVVQASVQPDLMRPRELPALRAVEAPRHFLDLELLLGRDLPEERWRYLQLLTEIAAGGPGPLQPGTDLTQVGTLPYSLVEGTERLAAILVQLRAHPDDPGLEAMAAQQAGFVSHYAQDLCQPLHTSIHHDGRARQDGSSPRSGIHRQVDSLIHTVIPHRSGHPPRKPQVLEPLFPAVIRELEESHSHRDRVYELEGRLGSPRPETVSDPDLVKFATGRFEQAVAFTADLLYTAWHLSASVELPDWFHGSNPTDRDSR